ncbi:peptidase S8 and S53, subtilisin, kexin, sedolisin [Plesiocystis pacifica SIR-1]|uniref:Peptidase S8 and S53, subtilisin, kexin, sedolisin n=1 Tax=Plesiocystis pacifica SIR-1 TaxID=391625 RepID=A6GFT5_9BACT|nr:CFI-box-CTERM domain-containing protein [Plesiocystis pacifica]EDM75282.1 peptidase S8 and S53, subtilisin, kexin, sedolisin [Plesiocystis pacifica SIR-1]
MAYRLEPARALTLSAMLGVSALALGAPAHAAPGDEEGGEGEGEPTGDPADDEALLEFHFSPVENTQIAVWIEDVDGNHLEDVFVTQATGKLGIGNRPGWVEFLSSWRAPYGARESVLPIWAHRRGVTYPKIIFHDPNKTNHSSLGFHEISSSPETYFCRPLTPTEDDAIVDTMTCPSPATFQSDKGEIDPGETSVYPPRNDLTSFDDDDGEDPPGYADLNDLDAVTGATPEAGPYMVARRIRRGDVPEGPLVAWIEVSLENDQNADWSFNREDDHWVDPKLPAYGREYFGQPAVVYRVEFDPAEPGYTSVTEYGGYADWDGATGTIHAPDNTISTEGGSGSDRLQVHSKFNDSARFGVYTHGWGEGGGGGGGGGACGDVELPPVEAFQLEATAYNEIYATFRIPELPEGSEVSRLRAYWQTPETDDLQTASATEATGIPSVCQSDMEVDCVDAKPGDTVSIPIDQLFGNYTYTVGVAYEDTCTNESPLAFADATTPTQPFQTIDGACFIATAAWGAGWVEELRALRWFRDEYMVGQPIAHDMVRMYYAYGPTLAKMIRDVPPARAAVRLMLRPVANVAKSAVLAEYEREKGPAADYEAKREALEAEAKADAPVIVGQR